MFFLSAFTLQVTIDFSFNPLRKLLQCVVSSDFEMIRQGVELLKVFEKDPVCWSLNSRIFSFRFSSNDLNISSSFALSADQSPVIKRDLAMLNAVSLGNWYLHLKIKWVIRKAILFSIVIIQSPIEISPPILLNTGVFESRLWTLSCCTWVGWFWLLDGLFSKLPTFSYSDNVLYRLVTAFFDS